jgi:hypothetical protein
MSYNKDYYNKVYKHKRYIREDFTDFQNDFSNLWKTHCKKYPYKPSILPKVDRIIVLGDIHGDWNIMIKMLKIAKLIDDKNNWIGGKTIVVQVGDQIDRCRLFDLPCNDPNATENDEMSDLKILNYLTELNNMASKHGGAVYSLIGNHELMNVNGDMRYVSYQGLKEFENYPAPLDNKSNESKRALAFKKGNEISNFLGCTRQMAIIIGNNLFVHAGILPSIAEKYSIKDLNQILSLYLWDKLNDSENYKDILYSYNSPLWNRDIGKIMRTEKKSQETLCTDMTNSIESVYKVGKIFVGHEPQIEKGISNICNGKIWLTDYGASHAFNKFDNSGRSDIRKAQVLEILDDGKIINILK